MRKAGVSFLTLLIPLVFSACSPKGELPERIMEDGVEVVLNRIEPYTIEGTPGILSLQQEFTIDTERDEIAGLGLTDIGNSFDIDSQGNIYLNGYENADGTIFKFDKEGSFVRSFGRKGQGPGEIQGRNLASLFISVGRDDNIAVSDFGNKLVVFDSEGQLIDEKKIDPDTISIVPLSNGNLLSYIRVMEAGGDFINQNPLTLTNREDEVIKELDKQMVPNPIIGKKLKASYHILSWSIGSGKIFTGFQERGYEISVFDFEGNLLRKIKKEFQPIPIPEEYKTTFMEQFSAPIFDDIRSRIYFPDAMPPFHSFFADDEGRLFVMTYEEGGDPSESVYDVFDPDGVCIGRTFFKTLHDEGGVYAKMKSGRLFSLHEKESGYKELVVSKTVWE
jgi:hypothetical protein